MAITFIEEAKALTASYNPIIYRFDSDNSGEAGFRYQVEITEQVTNKVLGRVRVTPKSDGSGEIDISPILRNYVEVEAPFEFSDLAKPSVMYNKKYKVKVTESYISAWYFESIQGYSVGGILHLQLHTTTIGNNQPYANGDRITINVNSSNPAYDIINGVHKVLVVNAVNRITIDLPMSSVSTGGLNSLGGSTVSYPTVLYEGDSVETAGETLDVALDLVYYKEEGNTLEDYISMPSSYLTSLPSKYYLSYYQDLYLLNYFDIGVEDTFIEIKTSENSGFIDYTVQNGFTYINLSPSKINEHFLVDNGYEIITPDTKWFEVNILLRVTLEPITKTIKISLDHRCTPNDYQVLFKDRMGSYTSFAFGLKEDRSIRTSKSSFKLQSYSRETYSKAKNVFSSNQELSYTLRTNWLNDDMNMYFEELLTSRSTYMKIDGYWYQVEIREGNFETQRTRFRTLIRRTITVTVSKDTPIN